MNGKLAIEGGTAVRSRPLPQEWCGAHYMDEQEIEAATRVCKSKTLFRYYGLDLQNEVSKLEQEFATYIGIKYALAVSSGTGALQVALGALGVGPGDEVLIPGYFWVATVGAVVRSGAIPVLVDCDDSFSMDPKDAVRKITPRTKVILVVHMGGVIGRIKDIVALAKQHKLKIIEDSAQANGASQHGVKAGAFGDMAIFSFQMNKHMTSGEGGMVVTNDPHLYRRAFAIHDLGYARNEAGRLVFDDPSLQLWGIGCRMSELTAAVARVQLGKLDRITGAMRSAKNKIKQALAGTLTFREVPDPKGDAGSFLLTVFPTREQSLKFTEALRAEGIVAAKDGLYPIHMDQWGLHIYYNVASLVNKRGISTVSPWQLAENRASAGVSYAKGACPHLDDLLSRTMIACVASVLTDTDVQDIIKAYRKVAAVVCK
ncbi:MAG: DegT/DnrJ/EryC1/StrS family aminotransferase [Verrucomicrobia bacterium]|nr:DegT/DnrJ/EryC1/StrS family aminotransferase [Verrucomicrobiota bacterium]